MSETLENLSREDRRFPPSPEFTADAVATEDLYREAADDREAFWADQGRQLDWAQEWSEVLDWSEAPFAKWFVSGTLKRRAQLCRPARRRGQRRPGRDPLRG
jgi:acetyl-CoA synthetase